MGSVKGRTMTKSTMMLLSATLLFPFLLSSNTSAVEDPVEYEPATTDAAEPTATTITVPNILVRIDGKKVKCEFVLVFLFDDVDISRSSMQCNRGFGKSVDVEFTREGYTFRGVIKPPKKIISMTGGDIFGGFMANIRGNDSEPIEREGCGGYGVEVILDRGYTTTNTEKWTGGVVEFAYISDGTDELKDSAFDVDATVGFNKAELATIVKAMKRIEEKTCIRFHRIDPTPGKNWLLLMRVGNKVNGEKICHADYIHENLKDKTYGDLGKVFSPYPNYPPWRWNADAHCFGGAFTLGLGMMDHVSYLVASMTQITNSENSIGLFTHELGHTLGIGHTQKRPDRDDYITVNWGNIQEGGKAQYQKCEGAECDTYDTPYDCSSIMHYTDTAFKVPNVREPTMTPKNPDTCILGDYGTKLTETDVSLLRKMYCDQSHNNLLTSHEEWGTNNYPNAINNRPSNIRVEEGNLIEIRFTDFELEGRSSSSNCYDWVRIVDGDGTELLGKTCATEKPMTAIRSKTNRATLFFHTDGSVTNKGYRAEWGKVRPEPPVNGGWSDWSAYGSCANARDGKSTCTQSRFRFCNNPVPSRGGMHCQGSSAEMRDCSSNIDGDSHEQCVIHGGWSDWSTGSVCNSECQTTKTRTCTSPTPINSKACEGESSLTTSCTGGRCNSGNSGEVTSPGYPNNYGINIDHQTTTIEVSANSNIELTFVDFELEGVHPETRRCDYDFVQVLDSDGSELLKACGTSLPDKVISTGNRLQVVFKSDHSVTKKGFRATWEKISAVGGIIMSPNFPQLYDNGLNQDPWVLQAPRGYKVQLTFNQFDVEPGNDGSCNFDYVEVSYGMITIRYCNLGPPQEPIVSSGRTMTVKFFTDGSVQHTGFHASWTSVPA